MAGKPYNYLRFTLGGTIKGVQEWSTGLSFQPEFGDLPPSAAVLDSFLTELEDVAISFWDGTGGHGGLSKVNSADVVMSTLRLAYYSSGTTAATGLAERELGSSHVGQNPDGSLPTQCCLVATLLTGGPGRSHKGRMYLPVTSMSGAISLTGHLVRTAQVDDLTAEVVQMIKSINDLFSATIGNATVSVAGQLSAFPVTAVRMDNEVDIQRRRADKLAGNYTANLLIV